MYMYRFISFALLFCFFSCGSDEEITLVGSYIYKLSPDNQDSIEIKVELYDNRQGIEMKLSLRNNNDGYLFDMGAMSNADFNPKSLPNPIRKVNMDTDSTPEYIVECSVMGSTYGAFYNFIIWFQDDFWYITKIPFDRAFIEDKNSDGIYEIINYKKDSTYDSYQFIRGNLNPLE